MDKVVLRMDSEGWGGGGSGRGKKERGERLRVCMYIQNQVDDICVDK